MEELVSGVRKCFSLSILLFSINSFSQEFLEKDSIRASKVNDYFNSMKDDFQNIDSDTNEFNDSLEDAKFKIKPIYEFSTIKSRVGNENLIFEENLPEGSYICKLSTSGNYNISFLVGIVESPLEEVSQPIRFSGTEIVSSTFTHKSNSSNNFRFFINTGTVFTDVNFNLKCRKVI